MPDFEYSRWDGSQEFTPQSADKLFDQISEYMLDYGEYVLDNLEDLAEELIGEEQPIAPLFYYSFRMLVSPRVQGWEDHNRNVHPARFFSVRDE